MAVFFSQSLSTSFPVYWDRPMVIILTRMTNIIILAATGMYLILMILTGMRRLLMMSLNQTAAIIMNPIPTV